MNVGDVVSPTTGKYAGKLGKVKVISSTAPAFMPGVHEFTKSISVKFPGSRTLQAYTEEELMVQKEIPTVKEAMDDMIAKGTEHTKKPEADTPTRSTRTGNPFLHLNLVPKDVGPGGGAHYNATVDLTERDPEFYITVLSYLQLPYSQGGCARTWDWPTRLVGPWGTRYWYDDTHGRWQSSNARSTMPFANVDVTTDPAIPVGEIRVRSAREARPDLAEAAIIAIGQVVASLIEHVHYMSPLVDYTDYTNWTTKIRDSLNAVMDTTPGNASVDANKAPVGDENPAKVRWATHATPDVLGAAFKAEKRVADIMELVDTYADAKTCKHDAGNRPELYTQTDEELDIQIKTARETLLAALRHHE